MGGFDIYWIVAIGLAYLLGNVPSAYLAGRLLTGKDIREVGDQNPGAANAYRTLGPKVGVAVGAADVGKGVIAVLLARVLTGSVGAEMAAGVAVVVGHNWPVFLQLRGGRGAASATGVLLALVPIQAVPLGLVVLVFLPIIRTATRALGTIMIPLPFLLLFTGASYYLVAYAVGLPVMVGVRHYFSTRKLPRGIAEQAEAKVLPQR